MLPNIAMRPLHFGDLIGKHFGPAAHDTEETRHHIGYVDPDSKVVQAGPYFYVQTKIEQPVLRSLAQSPGVTVKQVIDPPNMPINHFTQPLLEDIYAHRSKLIAYTA